MATKDVSFLIPARNEIYLEKTIRNILENIRGNSEILVYLDGYLPDPPLQLNDDRVIFHYPTKEPVGHRAATNYLARQAQGKYVCKIDAHCAIGEGFDLIMMADCEYDWTVIPRMWNLDIETWKPKNFDNYDHALKMGKVHDYISMGINEKNELSTLYYPHYENKKLHRERKDILVDETLSCMGCCFFMHKDRFWELEGCDENHDIWGAQAVEVSLKAWLSGGKLMVNKKTYFAHWFRGGGGAGWPYPITSRQVNNSRRYSTDLWLNNKWKKQVRPLSWLIERFWPVPSWTDDNLRSLKLAGIKFPQSAVSLSGVEGVANLAMPSSAFSDSIVGMPHGTESSSGGFSADAVSSGHVNSMGSESKVCGIAATPIIADMVNNGNISTNLSSQRANKPSIHNSVNIDLGASKSHSSVSGVPDISRPVPTPCSVVDGDFCKESDDSIGIKPVDGQIPFSHRPHYTTAGIDKSMTPTSIQKLIRNMFNLRASGHPSPIAARKGDRDTIVELWNKAGYKEGVEIGVSRGEFSERILKTVNGVKLHCIDPWDTYPDSRLSSERQALNYSSTLSRLDTYIKEGRCVIHKEYSDKASEKFEDGSLDFVFIDGMHTFDGCVTDLIKWVPKVRKGGMVALHDYCAMNRNGVVKAVDAYTYCHMIHPWYVTREIINTAFWVVE